VGGVVGLMYGGARGDLLGFGEWGGEKGGGEGGGEGRGGRGRPGDTETRRGGNSGGFGASVRIIHLLFSTLQLSLANYELSPELDFFGLRFGRVKR